MNVQLKGSKGDYAVLVVAGAVALSLGLAIWLLLPSLLHMSQQLSDALRDGCHGVWAAFRDRVGELF